MKIRDAQLELRKLGMVLTRTEHGEFRVNFKGGKEATAYYTDDLGDAVGTAKSMSKEKPRDGAETSQNHKVSKVGRSAASQALDHISDHIERLRQDIPREASNLRRMALRLDRVANTLEAEQEVTDRVSKIENELDDLGVDFTVAPNSSEKQATCIYAYKGQLNSRNEASVLSRIAKKHGSTLENGNRTYKITVPHHI